LPKACHPAEAALGRASLRQQDKSGFRFGLLEEQQVNPMLAGSGDRAVACIALIDKSGLGHPPSLAACIHSYLMQATMIV
jgi:hypothetical protein